MDIFDKEEHEKIIDNTLTGFENVTDKGLINTYDFPSPLSSITGKEYEDRTKKIERANLEMTRRLKKEIQRFNVASSTYSKRILWLTITMLLVGVAQIGLFLFSLFTQA